MPTIGNKLAIKLLVYKVFAAPRDTSDVKIIIVGRLTSERK
jgi:hypothetical protein